MTSDNRAAAGVSLISVEDWRKYYMNWLIEDRIEFMTSEEPDVLGRRENYTHTRIAKEEVMKALAGMKNGAKLQVSAALTLNSSPVH